LFAARTRTPFAGSKRTNCARATKSGIDSCQKRRAASLPEKEVKRQAVIFEIIKSEKEYVADLEALQDVSPSSLVFTTL
jgi:hypothetical protein